MVVDLRKTGLVLRQGVDLHSPVLYVVRKHYYTIVHRTGPIFILLEQLPKGNLFQRQEYINVTL